METDLLLLLLFKRCCRIWIIMHIKDLPRQRFHHVQKLLLSVRVDVCESERESSERTQSEQGPSELPCLCRSNNIPV